MTLLAVLLLPFAAGAILTTFIVWPIAHRAGKRAEQRDQAEIARILGGYDAPPAVRTPIEWRPAISAGPGRRPAEQSEPASAQVATWARPTAAHASLRVATTPKGYRGRHTGALVLAHVKAADTYIGRPRELVSS